MNDTILTMKRNLAREQERQGVSDYVLAERTGLTRDTLRRYKSLYIGGTKLEIWLMISDALGHTGLDWLMDLEKDHKPEECRYHAIRSCDGWPVCLATKECDPCRGATCKDWTPREGTK